MTVLPPFLFPPVSWFLDAAQTQCVVGLGGYFEKQSLRNRCYIGGPNDTQALVVPIVHTGEKQLFLQTQISRREKWAKEHAHSLRSAYGKAPFYEFYDYKILPLIENTSYSLAELNQASIEVLCKAFDIPCPEFHVEQEATAWVPRTPQAYPQVFEDRFGFRPTLSALDLLFNLGPEAGDYLKSQP